MRIDIEKYRKDTCLKCEKFSKKPVFGKCCGTKNEIYLCVRRKIFSKE